MHHAVFNTAVRVSCSTLFSNTVYEAVKLAYKEHFPDAAVSNNSTIFDLLISGATLRSFYEHVETVFFYKRVGDVSNICYNYVG